jgi:hypothetical protein
VRGSGRCGSGRRRWTKRGVVGVSALALVATGLTAGAGPSSAAPERSLEARVGVAPGSAASSFTTATPGMQVKTLPKQTIVLGDRDATTPRSTPRAGAGDRAADLPVTGPITAQINVTYVGFPANARAAFQAAVDIWERQIHSSVPIDIVADWSDLPSQGYPAGILGAAGPSSFVNDFPNAPTSAYYPIALANALAGVDLLPANYCATVSDGSDPSRPDISASFNSNPIVPWYLGTDGRVPAGTVDLESVVLHELGHGLGFIGTGTGLSASGADQGRGYWGLSGDGTEPTIYDTFAGSSSAPVTSIANGSTNLGAVLRSRTGLVWRGANGTSANGGVPPVMYAPAVWQQGSSYGHLDQRTYDGTANALMIPMLDDGVAHHTVGPIVLGMFKDMGWPTSAAAPMVGLGSYHPTSLVPLPRLAARPTMGRTSMTVPVTGRFGVPASPDSVRAVAINIEVKNPNTTGYVGALPGCSAGPGAPSAGEFSLGHSRELFQTLPVDQHGNVTISLAGPINERAGVNVDLLGWYGNGGVYYHHLQNQLVAVRATVAPSRPVDVSVLGKAGIPTSGVTAVVFKARLSGPGTAYLALGPGGVGTQVPTNTSTNEMVSNLTTVPLGTGAHAGQVRVRTTGTALVSLEAVGYYSAARVGGLVFHPEGPARFSKALRGQELMVDGLPGNTQVMVEVHLSRETATGWIGSAPGGHPTLHGIQEYTAGIPIAGTIIATTNPAGQLRLRLSAGTATVYVDYQGWFSAN